MAYDASKDKKIKTVDIHIYKNNYYQLDFFSYDGGPIKMQISKYYIDKNNERKYTRGVGRLTLGAIENILGAFKSVVNNTTSQSQDNNSNDDDLV